ncbi:conserved domain protein [delta proteobacterium NaphS2]|nr:conserved domain protein [delta proteobacterium NaphS2]
MAEKLSIHRNTVLNRLKQLEEKGLVHKKGSGPRVRYTI